LYTEQIIVLLLKLFEFDLIQSECRQAS